MAETSVAPDAVMPIVRVAVLTDTRLVDLALPAELPLREILPEVRRLAAPTLGDGADQSGESMGGAERLSLAPIGGAPFSLDATLDTVGVADGDLLALRPVPAGPAAPGIVEDIADAAAIFSASRLRPWGLRHVRRGALAAVVGLILAATGLAAAHRALVGETAGVLALYAVTAVAATAALLSRTRSVPTALTLSLTALVPVAAAFTASVPGLFGAAHVMLGAAGVTAWSLICLILPSGELAIEHDADGRTRRTVNATAVFTATTVAGAAALLAAMADVLWQPGALRLGCGLIAGALLLVIAIPQLSALWARLPLPVIPAPGDPTPSALPERVLADLPRRVRAGDAHQTGLVAGASLIATAGSVAIAWHPEVLDGWAWYIVAATGAAAVLRARVWDSSWCKAWLLAQPYLTALALLVYYAATGRYPAAVVAAGVLTALTIVWVVAALNPPIAAPESYSLPVRRLVGFTGAAIDASLLPVIAYVVGLFAWILAR